MPLTSAAARNAKPEAKPRRFFGEGSLYPEPSPTGDKPWRFQYPIGGKEKRVSLGIDPDTDLAAAPAKRDAARKLLSAAVDPSEQRKAGKSAGIGRSANGFAVNAREWITARANATAAGQASRSLPRLINDVSPWIGARLGGNNTPNAALRRTGCKEDTVTGHGFRAMARTTLDDLQHIRPDCSEHQLAPAHAAFGSAKAAT
jgi:hypothetical protein